MRIEELHLDGFGHFHQRSIGLVSGPVTVFYGPNEAGKSTLLAFIRAILFGFPARFNSHHPPLAGGRHGGRITLSDSVGAIYGVERYAGARGGLNVATPDGPASNAEAVLRRLTGNATPDLFRNVFAFSLDELQAAASLNDSGGTIYSAGQGAPGLPTLMKSLSDHKGQIYLSRGNNQEVPRLLNTLRDIDAQLRVIEGNAVRYGAITARKSEIYSELQAGDAELSRLNARLREINSLLAGWDEWVALAGCEARLKEMPRFEQFPEEPIPRLGSLEERARQAKEDREEAAEQLRQAEEASDVDIPGENMLDDAGSIEAIRRARSSFDNSVRDLPERRAELRGMEADFARNLADLGHGWGETDLRSFDTSLVVRNQLERWKQRTTESNERAKQAQFQLDQERRTLLDHESATEEAREKLPSEPPPLDAAALTERQEGLRAARGHLGEYERQRQNHENLRGQLNAMSASRETQERASGRPNVPLVILMGMAGVVLIIAGLLIGGRALPLGIAGGLVLLAAAASLWYMGRPSPSAHPSPMASALGRQTADTETAEETARHSLLESAAALGLEGQPNTSALDSADAHLESARNALDAWNAANARVEESARREKLQKQRLEEAVREQEAAKVSAQEAQQEWRQWLRERELDETLTVDTMTTFLARVETARASLAEARRMRDRVAAIERDIEEVREQVEPLTINHGIPLDPEDRRQLAEVADRLIKKLEEAQTGHASRERAKEEREETQRLLDRQEQRLQFVEQELAALLEAGGADDPEVFRVRARQHWERLAPGTGARGTYPQPRAS